MTTPLVVDTRGMRCPWPALRLARAMRSEARVTLMADDPKAAREIAVLAAQQGWEIQEVTAKNEALRWDVRRS